MKLAENREYITKNEQVLESLRERLILDSEKVLVGIVATISNLAKDSGEYLIFNWSIFLFFHCHILNPTNYILLIMTLFYFMFSGSPRSFKREKYDSHDP